MMAGRFIMILLAPLTIDNCTFSGNSASGATGEGGAIYNNNGTLTIENNCSFSSNSASHAGGAIYNDTTGTLSIDSCTFSSNSASNGGAIYNNNGTLTIENNCSFSSNSAIYGGAIYYNNGTLTIDNCTFSGNSAAYGGAICIANSAIISCSRFYGNEAGIGRAIECFNGTVNAINNWWGTNGTPDPALFDGVVLFDPWMVVNLANIPTNPLPNQLTTINADFTKNSNGDTIPDCNIPDGVPVTFSTNQGILNSTSATTVNGIATTTLSPNNQSAKVCATVAPSQENYTLCSVVNPGFNRLNWGCVCGQTGDEGYFIGASADSASTDNKISAWSFDGSDNPSCNCLS